MKIYNYDANTKELTYDSLATESPVEEGVYIIPANATTIAPPQKKDGYALVFDENSDAWGYEEDHRGETVWSTSTKQKETVSYLGPIKEGYTTIEPSIFDVWDGSVWIPDIQAMTDAAKGRLRMMCDKKTNDAKNYINGAPVSDEQLRRYEEKYAVAKEYKATGAYAATLQLEADLAGITVDALAGLIIAAGDSYKEALISFNAMIEAFRVKTKAMIDAGDIAVANAVMDAAEALGADATPDDIRGLFV